MAQDINVLALVKGAERYVFLYNDASRAQTLRVLGRFASNPELSFSLVRRRGAQPEDPAGKPARASGDVPASALPAPTDGEETTS